MTKWIRMLETLSGGRADGRPWPPAGGVIEVADWEYDHNTNAGWAVHADPPEPEPEKYKPEPAKVPETVRVQTGATPVREVPAAPVQAQAEVPAAEPEPAEEAAPEPPRPSDSKQDWVDYAVTRGMDADKATAMSKADLMSRYGGRL